MRLLHTSDWHLGRTLHGADLQADQAAFLDHLVEVVATERIDAVLVAGDVYDRAIPPLAAVELCESALVRLRAAGARVVVSSGNHDSARRLGFAGPLVAAAGVHLCTRVDRLAEPVMLADRYGLVAVYGLPYLEPDAVGAVLPPDPADPSAPPPRGHAGVVGRALSAVRADLAARGRPRSVVLAHAWVAGGEAAPSERDITVGGVAAVPAGLFADLDYVALGHLHGRQALDERLRYSGSPLAYSFAEARQAKGSWLVELGDRGRLQVTAVPAPVPRRLSRLTGDLADLLVDPRLVDREDDYLAVTLTDPARPQDPMARLRSRFPHVLTLAWEPVGGVVAETGYGDRVRGRDDLEIALGFVEHVRRTPATPAERGLLRSALETARRRGDEPAADCCPAEAVAAEPAGDRKAVA